MSTYNGWTNYETWCVNLWIDNDQGLYEVVGDFVRDRLREAQEEDEEGNPLPPTDRALDDVTCEVSEYLKSLIEDTAPELQGLFADLLNAALSEVSWWEIAQSKIGDEQNG